jgi:hypothetical protein
LLNLIKYKIAAQGLPIKIPAKINVEIRNISEWQSKKLTTLHLA